MNAPITADGLLPEWDDCRRKKESSQPMTVLEKFIFDHEPTVAPEADQWRGQLWSVVRMAEGRAADDATLGRERASQPPGEDQDCDPRDESIPREACICRTCDQARWQIVSAQHLAQPPSVGDYFARLQSDVLHTFGVDISELTDELLQLYKRGGDASTKPEEAQACAGCEALKQELDHYQHIAQREIAAGRTVPPPGAWQPIETAPKTGRTILLAYSSFVSEGHCRMDGVYVPNVIGETITPFTHWMPMPTPPTKETKL